MWLPAVEVTGAIIDPDLLSRCRFQAKNEYAFERPDSGREIHPVLLHHGTAPNGPYRGDPLIPNQLPC